MEIINVHCPNCGAPIDIDSTSQAFICKFCSSVIAVQGQVSNKSEEKPQLRKVEPELQFKANHNINAFNAQGGHLWITPQEVVFKPHALNFGPLGKRYIRIQDVAGYKKGSLTQLSVYTNDGYEMSLAVWNKDEIINAIEVRRSNYYTSQGLPIPPLRGSHYSSGSSGTNPAAGAAPASQMSNNSGCLGALVAIIMSATLLWSILA